MIRPMRSSDVDRIAAIAVRAWQGIYESYRALCGDDLYRRLFPEAPGSKGEDVRRFAAQYPDLVWVCEEGGKVVGFVTFQFNFEKRIGIFSNNAVDPDCGLKGIGQQMYAAVLAEFRRRGMEVAEVTTGLDAGHARARRAYERAGFAIRLDKTTYYQIL